MKLFSDSLPFLKANFHCHTTESDGRLSPTDVAGFYEYAGYDVLAITDHRKVTQLPSTDNLLLIPGIEIDYTLPGQWVHVIGIGIHMSVCWDNPLIMPERKNLHNCKRKCLYAGVTFL